MRPPISTRKGALMVSPKLSRYIAASALVVAVGTAACTSGHTASSNSGVSNAGATPGSSSGTATTSSSSSTASSSPTPQPSGPGGGANARSGPATGGASGTVGSVSTSSFTLTTAAGQAVTVDEASSTTYQDGTSSTPA